ncbi:MAG: hypothetical protein LW823_08030 [Rickettsiales bacterium]|jgi:hypothetical protein|nr:hypothetical protein [Rickettsiales bacterium]
MGQPSGIERFIRDMEAFARPDWLGSDPRYKKFLDDVTRVGREVVTQERLLNINVGLLDSHYPQGFPYYARIKPQHRPMAKKICEASQALADATLRYQQAMNNLINEAAPAILERLGAAYGFTDKTTIEAIKRSFEANRDVVDNVADIMHQSLGGSASAELIPDALVRDMQAFLGTITSDESWFAYFRDQHQLDRLKGSLSEPAGAVPMIMIKSLSAINPALSHLTQRNIDGRDQLRSYWPKLFASQTPKK